MAAIESVKFFTKGCNGNLKAYVSVIYHGLVLKGIKLFSRKESGELFIAMPSQKNGDDYKDTFYFKDQKKKNELEKKIITEWEKGNK